MIQRARRPSSERTNEALRMDPSANDRAARAALEGKTIHLVGAGGAGVSSLFRLLSDMGHKVTACDRQPGAWIDEAKSRGLSHYVGHGPSHLDEADLVVVSSAVPSDIDELTEARRRGIPTWTYAEFLGLLTAPYELIAVAGTHGKTTTSAWVSSCLDLAGLDPSFVVGGEVPRFGGGARAGSGRSFVVEACEYGYSFLNLKPRFAGITNVEPDHLDFFESPENVIDSFRRFAARIRPDGALVLGEGVPDRVLVDIDPSVRVLRAALSETADFHAKDIRWERGFPSFSLVRDGLTLPRTKLGVPGRHNLQNGLVAAALTHLSGGSDEDLLVGLESFTGVGRRLEIVAECQGITIIDDYAHHPTEIRAALTTLRGLYPDRRLVVVFQPHQVSRTKEFFDDFARELASFDLTLLVDVFSVRESRDLMTAFSMDGLRESIERLGGRPRTVGQGAEAAWTAADSIRSGDVLVVMGAGDVNTLTPLIRDHLQVAVS